MEPRVATVYKCKQCSATVRQADQRLAHLHWHGSRDKDVESHFLAVDEVTTSAPARAEEASERRKSGPSPVVLVASLALLGIMAIVYVMTK